MGTAASTPSSPMGAPSPCGVQHHQTAEEHPAEEQPPATTREDEPKVTTEEDMADSPATDAESDSAATPPKSGQRPPSLLTDSVNLSSPYGGSRANSNDSGVFSQDAPGSNNPSPPDLSRQNSQMSLVSPNSRQPSSRASSFRIVASRFPPSPGQMRRVGSGEITSPTRMMSPTLQASGGFGTPHTSTNRMLRVGSNAELPPTSPRPLGSSRQQKGSASLDSRHTPSPFAVPTAPLIVTDEWGQTQSQTSAGQSSSGRQVDPSDRSPLPTDIDHVMLHTESRPLSRVTSTDNIDDGPGCQELEELDQISNAPSGTASKRMSLASASPVNPMTAATSHEPAQKAPAFASFRMNSRPPVGSPIITTTQIDGFGTVIDSPSISPVSSEAHPLDANWNCWPPQAAPPDTTATTASSLP